MKRIVLCLLAVFCFSIGSQAQASDVLFSDNFNSLKSGATYSPSSNTMANWDILTGGVMVKGTDNLNGYISSSSDPLNYYHKDLELYKYVRLGGISSDQAMVTKEKLNLGAGTYQLSLGAAAFGADSYSTTGQAQLIAHLVSGSDIVGFATVKMDHSASYSSDYATHTVSFELEENVDNVQIKLLTANAGRMVHIDNLEFVKVASAATPIPAAALLFVPGLAGMVVARRKFRA